MRERERKKRTMNLRGLIGVDQFHAACREHFVEWYKKNMDVEIAFNDTFIIWSCKTLQNYKALVACNRPQDQILAEYTYNGDKKQLYCDHYKKLTNECVEE